MKDSLNETASATQKWFIIIRSHASRACIRSANDFNTINNGSPYDVSAGNTAGKMIRRKICHRPAPSDDAAIAVGSVATSALEVVLTDDNLRNTMVEGTPLKRLGLPEDIAYGALYLASPAGSFITGKVIEIDGGLEAPNLELGLPDL